MPKNFTAEHNSVKNIMMSFVAIAFLAGCTYQAKPLTGTVVDMNTGKPLAGAVIVAKWFELRSDWFHSSEYVCYHVETLTADADGKFSTPAWKTGGTLRDPSSGENRMSIEAFKPGYVTSRNDPVFQNHKLDLTPFTGTPEEYAKYIHGLRLRMHGCGTDDKNGAGYQPLIAALDAEAQLHPYHHPQSVCIGCGNPRPVIEPGPRGPASGTRDGEGKLIPSEACVGSSSCR